MTFKQKLFYFCPVLFCFSLPFGTLFLSGIIILWTFAGLLVLDPAQIKTGVRKYSFILPAVFFLYTVVSALASSDKPGALFAVEIKMSLVLFPFFFFCFNWPLAILRRCVIAFVSGCFFACLFLLARATVYAWQGNTDYFFYTLFSDFIHVSYFAMYLVIAIVFVILFYEKWFQTQKSIIYSSYFFVSIFITCIFLCASKLGLISAFICLPVLFLYKVKRRFSVVYMVMIVFAMIVVAIAASKLLPGSFERLDSITRLDLRSLDKTSAESTTVRVLIWEQGLQLIKENFWLGTGAGDADTELYSLYEKNGLTGALAHKLNAHNQFLETFIGLGVAGFLLLLLMTFGQAIAAIKRRNFLLFIFSLLIVLNFLVESMLQASAGVLFFMFFYCLFNLTNEEELKSG